MKLDLLNKEVQSFIDEQLNSDLNRIVLKGSPFKGIAIGELAEQIDSKRRSKHKLPTWFSTPAIYYPNRVNIEQSSSERTASFKASLVSGFKLADLTGGFGVDSYFFSKKIKDVSYCEIEAQLYEIAVYNFKLLGATHVKCARENGIEFLKNNSDSYDWIYLDPSRRDSAQERVFRLEDCRPNLLENLEFLRSKTKKLMVKLAPLLDITLAIRQLKTVEEVYVVALDNEVKELLFILNQDVNNKTKIHAVNLKKEGLDKTSFVHGQKSENPIYRSPETYLYEPNAAILKAGLFNEIAEQFKLNKLHPNSHLYSSTNYIDFPGRAFMIHGQYPYQPKKIMKLIGVSKANITVRNFKDSVSLIRKKTKLAEGGDDYLFFTTNSEGKALVIHCRKLNHELQPIIG